MSHADFLSRNPLPDCDVHENATINVHNRKNVNILHLQKEWIVVEQQRDHEISQIMSKWRTGDLPNDLAGSYDIRKGILYRKIQQRFDKTRIKHFKQGDFVFLKNSERNQTKLDRKFRGPFKIISILENDRYELQHVDGSKRIYKYPHESLREVPRGRAGLTELAEALCEQALNEDTVSATNDNAGSVRIDDSAVSDVVVNQSISEDDKIDDDDTVSLYRICDEDSDGEGSTATRLADQINDDDLVNVWRICDDQDE
ncbi:uncharacterized protein LOC123695648 [Colias croceus]|uniref:uncharacterized protein LOC123695648 n=1 Tax=Colias crocea TaxID=72248 RepID=UPI001E27F62D|nr:uncharacterized protein LOC123695648 [Colias croceus]